MNQLSLFHQSNTHAHTQTHRCLGIGIKVQKIVDRIGSSARLVNLPGDVHLGLALVPNLPHM